MTPSVTANTATRQYQAASAPDRALAGALRGARVTSRSLGLSLGRFGLSYESAGVTLPERSSPEAERARREFCDACEATGLYDVLGRPAPREQAPQAPETSALARRRGLAAYARQSEGPAPYVPPMLRFAV